MGLTGYEALRFDLASAYLGEYSDYDREGAYIDEILSGFVMLAKVQGAKKIKQPKRKRLVGNLFEKEERVPTVEEVIAQLNTPGTVIMR